MAKIVFGDDFVEENCVMVNLINANSPMTYDSVMLGALKNYSRHNQAVMPSPFIVAGAMSPVTAAAVAAQSLAEGLVGMALAQLVRPARRLYMETLCLPCPCSPARQPLARLRLP